MGARELKGLSVKESEHAQMMSMLMLIRGILAAKVTGPYIILRASGDMDNTRSSQDNNVDDE